MHTESSSCFGLGCFSHQLHKVHVCIDWIFKETSFTYDLVPERGRNDMKSPPNPLAALQAVSIPGEKQLMILLVCLSFSCQSWVFCLSHAQKLFCQWQSFEKAPKKIVFKEKFKFQNCLQRNCFHPRTTKLFLCCLPSDLLNQGQVVVLLV